MNYSSSIIISDTKLLFKLSTSNIILFFDINLSNLQKSGIPQYEILSIL